MNDIDILNNLESINKHLNEFDVRGAKYITEFTISRLMAKMAEARKVDDNECVCNLNYHCKTEED